MPTLSSFNAWVKCLNPLPSPTLRLFCLPYAGGGSAIFRPWLHQLPSSIEICPIQLPGREERLRERPLTQLAPLVQTLAQELYPYLDVPFAFFGHSMGALISFELTRQLRSQQAPLPVHLLISGRSAPHISDGKRLHMLSDQALLQELRTLKGTPQSVLDSSELMQLLLPTLRADFSICETYTYIDRPPLNCAISVFGGESDPEAPLKSLQDWSLHTCSPLSLHLLPGDHFFLHTSRPLLLEKIAHELSCLDSTTQPNLIR